MVNRPEWIACIELGEVDRETWCKRVPHIGEWTFTSVDRAIASVLNGSQLVPCGSCSENVCIVLKNGSSFSATSE